MTTPTPAHAPTPAPAPDAPALAVLGYRVVCEEDGALTVAYAPDGRVLWRELTFPFSEGEDAAICWEKCAEDARDQEETR